MTSDEPANDRNRAVARIDRLLVSLAAPLSRRERHAGWTPEAVAALADHFNQVRDRLHDQVPLNQQDLPGAVDALRGLDAWGIDVLSDSRLLAEVLDLSRELRSMR